MLFWKKVDFLAIGFTRPIFSLFLIYVGYLLIGSICFVMLESAHETQARNEALQAIRLTQAMIRRLRSANYSNGDINKAFLMQHSMNKSLDNQEHTKHGYQMFGESVLFAFILISTIGYGNVAPKTMVGQCVCVIFTMLGLPIHAIMMRLLSVKFRGALKATFKVALRFFPGSRMMIITSGFLFFLSWTTIFLFIPPCIFMANEKWDYHQAFYFSYVSLTTIGLGDYVTGVSERNLEGLLYTLELVFLLIWMFFGLGFVTMAVNMMSYVMGIYTLDKLDCKCRERTAAMRKLQVLLDLMKELNWQLVKGKPDDFENWTDIEEFRNLLAENPQDVSLEILNRMFDIIVDLKEKAYDQISRMQFVSIPTTPILQHARDHLPEILSTDSMTLNPNQPASKIKGSTKMMQSTPDRSQESFQIPNGMEVRKAASHTSFEYAGSFERESSQECPETFAPANVTVIEPSDIIVDRSESLIQDNEDIHDSEKNANSKDKTK